MSALRGGTKIWNAVSVSPGDKSAFAIPGPGPYVAVFVANTDAAVDAVVLDIECAVSDTVEAGRNALSSAADGGLTWFKYERVAGTPIQITVNHGKAIMVDLSPFAPQFIRLLRSDNGGAAVLSAWIAATGT